MAALRNAKRERFAQELAKGKPAYVAHKTAGFSGDRGDASKLQREPSIVQRVEEIMLGRAEIERAATEQAAAELAIDKRWVMSRLVENADRAMQAIAVKDHDGEPTGEYRYDGAVANRSLELIGKELGMFIDRKQIDIDGELRSLSDAALVALLQTGSSDGDGAEADRALAH